MKVCFIIVEINFYIILQKIILTTSWITSKLIGIQTVVYFCKISTGSHNFFSIEKPVALVQKSNVLIELEKRDISF